MTDVASLHMISVIIPVYNMARYVREAVDSALAQTYRDIEVIVVDDGSTDGSTDALRDIDDPRLRVIRQDHGGQPAARNTALRAASGEYVACLDADDRWAPRNLERQAAFLETHPEVDMTFCHSLIIDEAGRLQGTTCSSWAGPLSFSQLMRNNEIGNASCVLVRRQALDRAGWFDTTLPSCVDIDAWMRVANLRPGNLVGIPEALSFYRRWPSQISGDWRRMERGFLNLLEHLRQVAPLEVEREEHRSRAGRYRYYARQAREAGETRVAVRLLATAFCWAPLWLLADSRTWLIGMAVLCQLLLPRPIYLLALRWGQRLLGSRRS